MSSTSGVRGTLRTGQLQARAGAVARIVATAETFRAAGMLDEAQRELQRAQQLDPQNRRLEALVANLLTERRQQADSGPSQTSKRVDASTSDRGICSLTSPNRKRQRQ